MSGVREKKLGNLYRRRVWPSVFALIFFAVACLATFAVFLYLFVMCIMGTKVVGHYEDAQRVSGILSALMDGGDTVEEAAEEMHDYILGNQDICVVDRNRNIVFLTGDSEPDFTRKLQFKVGREFTAVADSKSFLAPDEGMRTIQSIPVKDIVGSVFDPMDKKETRTEWLGETVIRQDYWLRVPFRDETYALYVKSSLQAQRQDIIYVYLFGFGVMALLLIPMVLLFVNTIRTAVLQRRMSRLIYLDTVTGGRNWLFFQNYAHRILSRIRNNKKAFALVNLHLERYQNYRACYGVKAGDELLEAMSGFLNARVGKNESFARYEGADFGMLLACTGESEKERQENCRKRVRSLLAELTGLRPNQKIHFHAGIDMIPPYVDKDGKWYHRRKDADVEQLYTYANAARLESDTVEEQRITFFDQDMLGRQKWERWVEDTMETALHNGEFQVYLQPKYSPASGKLVGAEALVRWVSLSTGMITPSHFIPIFERTGFITQLDDYMISKVAKMQAEWMIQGRKMIPISVNVSRAHFAQEGLAEHICGLVDAYGPDHGLIELEVTESAFFDDKDILIETVKQLKAYGFRVSMDDFGAGYSSLNSLKDIPLDVLKLDGEFFQGDEEGAKRGEIVVREAIRLARDLDMCVVAEGIEKKEQVDFLTRQGCDMIQGFYYAKPMPVEEFEKKVEEDA